LGECGGHAGGENDHLQYINDFSGILSMNDDGTCSQTIII
jgi:hypothetical protein